MTRVVSKILVFLYIFPFASFSVSLAQSSPETSGVDSRVKRVEQGLLPAVLVKGDPSWLIEDRMKHYKVPGLSVAVINNHKIDWARSYGITDIEIRKEDSRLYAEPTEAPRVELLPLSEISSSDATRISNTPS